MPADASRHATACSPQPRRPPAPASADPPRLRLPPPGCGWLPSASSSELLLVGAKSSSCAWFGGNGSRQGGRQSGGGLARGRAKVGRARGRRLAAACSAQPQGWPHTLCGHPAPPLNRHQSPLPLPPPPRPPPPPPRRRRSRRRPPPAGICECSLRGGQQMSWWVRALCCSSPAWRRPAAAALGTAPQAGPQARLAPRRTHPPALPPPAAQ